MSTTTPSLSLSVGSIPSIFRPKLQNPAKTHQLSPVASSVPSRKSLAFHKQAPPRVLLHKKKSQFWSIPATPEEISQEIVSSSSSSSSSSSTVAAGGAEDGVSVIIQVLLFAAFAALTILTIGVVYIAVSDFLEKRERDKFEREEANKKPKKSRKKNSTRARAGPRGFGQKTDEDDDDLS